MDHNQLVSIFEEEFLPQLEALYAFAYHLTRNQTDAEDLVQDTYLKAQRFIAGYEQGTNAKAWLFRILKNTFLNKYRSQTKKGTRIEFEEELGYQTEELGVNISQGVVVENLMDGGSAQYAGIQPKDIIVKAGGKEIKSVAELQEVVGRAQVGSVMELTINRRGKEMDFSVQLKAQKSQE
jgi:RNA polymerase sigma factor (sigma-70 family)